MIDIKKGDCRDVLKTLDEKSTDPNSRHFSANNENKNRFTKQQLAQIIREEFASVVKGK